MQFHILDYCWLAFYLLILIVLAYRAKQRSSSDAEDFLLASRTLTLPLFVATLIATWYGAILGVGEFVYTAGIAGWFAFGVPYYIAAMLYAKYLAEPVRTTPSRTIPEQIRLHYGPIAGVISAILILVLTLPVSYILSFGILIELFGNFPRWIAILLGTLFSLFYLITGGFRAGVLTDFFQCILMYTGFILLSVFTLAAFGSPDLMIAKLPSTHLTLPGTYSWQFLLVWYVIALQTLVDPGFHQRCAAVRNPKIAKKGILIAIAFWFLFDMMTLTLGLYARAYLSEHIQDPLFTYPVLADTVLPPMLKGLFFVAVLATIMSTLDSYGFISAMTLSYDIFPRFFPKKFRRYSDATRTKIALIIIGFSCVALALLLPSIVQLIYYSASIAVSGLLFPLLISYHPEWHVSERTAVFTMLTGSLAAMLWIIFQFLAPITTLFAFALQIEPMFIGLLVAFLTQLVLKGIEEKSKT